MWIPKSNVWNKDMTPSEQFLAERFLQRCDYDEAISKKHRTINGYTQLNELIKLCELSLKRIRTVKTLVVILKEAQSETIKQNINNDLIVNIYFQDLKKYIKSLNPEEELKTDNLDKVRGILYNLKKFSIQLEKYYFSNLLIELNKIDFKEEVKIQRELMSISNLIDLIIPFYLHKGYSINSLNEVFKRWINKGYHINLARFTKFFNNNKNLYELLVYIGNNELEINEIRNVVYKSGLGDIKSAKIFNSEFYNKKQYIDRDKVIYYSTEAKDPISFIRNQYDFLLRNLVINRDRNSLSIFNTFFKHSYFRRSTGNQRFFTKIKVDSDPISVNSRTSTLINSLIKDSTITTFNKNSQLDFIKDENLKKAIFYYNLGLGSKSIENSLSLIWTSLECILPYRIFKPDIENIRYILSKTISVGAFTRDIKYLIKRINSVDKVNDNCFEHIRINELDRNINCSTISKWMNWLLEDSENKFSEFNKQSSLLAFEYSALIRPISTGKLKFILDRINSSKESIEYQLQRIYLHRNQIVHSGDYINEYTNLWIHLEWYVGKLLYIIVKENEINKNFESTESLFLDIESQFDFITSYLEKNSSKNIKDSKRILESLYKIA